MRALKERSDAFEAYFVHQETEAFFTRTHEARRVGLWAAETMGMAEDAASRYAQALVAAQIQGGASDPVFDKLRADFAASGLPFSEAWLRRQLAQIGKG